MNLIQQHRPLRKVTFLFFVMIVAMVPFAVSALGVSRLLIRELLIPLLFAFTFLDFAFNTKNINLFMLRSGNYIGVFIGLFMFMILISFIRNPLLPSSVTGSDDGSGFKGYWGFLVALLTYLTTIYWINRNRIPPDQAMQILGWLALAVTTAGMFAFTTGITMPGLDTHAWSVNETEGFGEAAGSVRIPFLELFGQLGFLLVLTRVAFNGRFRALLLIYFLVTIYLGGGRVAMLSTFSAIAVWLFLNRRFMMTGIVLACALFALLSLHVIQAIAPNPQLARLTRLGSIKESSEGRYYVMKYAIEDFMKHPFFGTGYGKEYNIGLIKSRGKFIEGFFINKQLYFGSHMTHVQILKNLGLAGYIPFLLIWLYPVKQLLPIAMSQRRSPALIYRYNTQFAIVIISALLIRMIVEGNGSEPNLYIYAAIFASVINHVIDAPKAMPTAEQAASAGGELGKENVTGSGLFPISQSNRSGLPPT